MVHRPRYHDWSWPKGKTENGESLVAAAVREVEEETGQIITLGAPLTTQRYRLGGGQTKEVHYWVGTPVPAGHASERLRAPVARAPRTEIDQTAWTSPERAADMLTRRGDRRLLADIVARAREGRLADRGDGDGQVEGGLDRPLAGALLRGGVHDEVDEGLAGLRVHLAQDLNGDLHEVGVELALVPGGENVGDLRRRGTQALAQEGVGLGDDLHVGVLDAVVHHLHEVAGAVRANVRGAGDAVVGAGDGLEHGADAIIRGRGSAGHDGGTPQGALLAAGDARAHEVQAAFGGPLLAADRVGEQGVAAVDDDVALVHEIGELAHDGVRRRAGLDHHDGDAGRAQGRDEVLQRGRGNEGRFVAVLRHELLGASRGPVEDGGRVAVAGQVAGEVGAHDSQAVHADVGRCLLGGERAHAITLLTKS